MFAGHFETIFASPPEVPLPYDTVERMDNETDLAPDSPFYEWWINFSYMEIIGSVLYLAINTRPDIMYSVCVLARFNNNRTPQACYRCAHLLSYIFSGTIGFGLNYLYSELKGPGYILHEAYSDADFAGDRKTYCWIPCILRWKCSCLVLKTYGYFGSVYNGVGVYGCIRPWTRSTLYSEFSDGDWFTETRLW